MELTAVQRRTLEDLFGAGSAPMVDEGLAEWVADRLEAGLAALGLDRPGPTVWLGKSRLAALDRCPGWFAALVAGERPPFELTARTAAGRLFHKAIELDVVVERGADPRSVCERAARGLQDDRAFRRFWAGLDGFERAGLLVEAGRRLTRFRDSFPPLQRRWAPQPEFVLKAALARGRVVLSGAPDLVLGRRRRLVLDLKAFGAWPEHAQDLRFYALLVLLRTGLPPYRVATVFLESGAWQAEDVDETILIHAADRVLRAVAAAVGPGPSDSDLRPGRHCAWCPRAARCPASALVAGEGPAGGFPDTVATAR